MYVLTLLLGAQCYSLLLCVLVEFVCARMLLIETTYKLNNLLLRYYKYVSALSQDLRFQLLAIGEGSCYITLASPALTI